MQLGCKGACRARTAESGGLLRKIVLLAALSAALCAVAGCAAEFSAPFDLYSLHYQYKIASDSDGRYIVLTGHKVSSTDIKIPDTINGIPVREVGESVFAEDKQIRSVTFGKNVTTVGANAFGGCSQLERIAWNVSMSDIGAYAFRDCRLLEEVILPEHVTSIGRGAFYNCKWTKKITVPATVRTIGGRAFGNTTWLNIKGGLQTFVVEGDRILIAYNGCDPQVTVPDQVICVAGAFAGNEDVQTVSLPAGLELIGDMAFMGCRSLTELTIPDSVTEIGDDAFYGCTSLQKLVIGHQITRIGENAFSYCGAQIFVEQGSAAETYCKNHRIDYYSL